MISHENGPWYKLTNYSVIIQRETAGGPYSDMK